MSFFLSWRVWDINHKIRLSDCCWILKTCDGSWLSGDFQWASWMPGYNSPWRERPFCGPNLKTTWDHTDKIKYKASCKLNEPGIEKRKTMLMEWEGRKWWVEHMWRQGLIIPVGNNESTLHGDNISRAWLDHISQRDRFCWLNCPLRIQHGNAFFSPLNMRW